MVAPIATLHYIRLPRAVLHIGGHDNRDFLQGLISNDIAQLDKSPLLYAALLSPQGKFLHDFMISPAPDGVWLDTEAGARADDLITRLNTYRLRRQVTIAPSDRVVFAGFGHAPAMPGAAVDPRSSALGWRVYTDDPDATAAILHAEGYKETDHAMWDLQRIQLAIPDGSRDAQIGVSTLEELNITKINGVSFTKGCYVGQELTARMEHRGLAKKHLYPVTLLSGPNTSSNDIYHGDELIGELRSHCNGMALALLRDHVVERLRAANPQTSIALAPTQNGWAVNAA